MNYYNFHIGDYAAHTKHLSLLEDLAYRRLIDAYYLAERPFIGSSTDVAREIGMRDQIEAVEYVLSKFFTKTEDGFSHVRCDDEIAHYQDKRSKASNAGKASAERRNNVRSTSVKNNPTSVGNSATDVQPTNNQEPITNNQEKEKTKTRAARFDAQAHLVGLGVDPSISSDWIRLRKTKRAEVTATAIDGVSREADKAGMSLDAALRECCSRGWAGFKAEWMQARDSPGRVIQHQTVEQRNKAVAAAWVPPEMRGVA